MNPANWPPFREAHIDLRPGAINYYGTPRYLPWTGEDAAKALNYLLHGPTEVGKKVGGSWKNWARPLWGRHVARKIWGPPRRH